MCCLSDEVSLEGGQPGMREQPGKGKVFQAQPAFPLGSVISFRSCGSFQQRMVFRNQDLGAWCASCYGGFFASRPSRWTELADRSIYFYIHMLTCMHVEVYPHVSTSVLVSIPIHRLQTLGSPRYLQHLRVLSSFPPSHTQCFSGCGVQ